MGHCCPPKSQMHLPVRYATLLSYLRLLGISDSSRAQRGTVIPVVTVDHIALNIMAFSEAILHSDSVWKSGTDTQHTCPFCAPHQSRIPVSSLGYGIKRLLLPRHPPPDLKLYAPAWPKFGQRWALPVDRNINDKQASSQHVWTLKFLLSWLSGQTKRDVPH